jgi:hypothetical protein
MVSSKSSPKYALRILDWLIHVLKDEGGIDVGTRESNQVHVQAVYKRTVPLHDGELLFLFLCSNNL